MLNNVEKCKIRKTNENTLIKLAFMALVPSQSGSYSRLLAII